MKTFKENGLPVKMWLDDIEDGAMEQIKHLALLPFAFKWIAIMPDSHQGYGMPIGGVLATDNVIIPNAVGVDIGCGMCAVKTSLTKIDIETLKKIMGEIRKAVPVGFNHHNIKPSDAMWSEHEELMPEFTRTNLPTDEIGHVTGIVNQEFQNALTQIGTLGGGNHFIEIQKGSDGHIWVMIHSGSRNFGLKIADHYNKLAKTLNVKWNSSIPADWDLAFLPVDSEEGQAYIKEMNYAVEFAFANRKLMMDRICEIIKSVCLNDFGENQLSFEPMINIAHNYARLENHYGKNVWVHRKGATLATKDTIGIIPGSQGTKSYIVKGKGNEESFQSCSHGAGRKMGRKQAQRELNLEEEIKRLDDQGIVHGIRNASDLDEASGAYKDIDVVMKNQEDLVEILVELTPLGVIKG